MDIYDKSGRLIGYVNSNHISKTPLEDTGQVGEGKRDEWLRDLAQRSTKENLNVEKARAVVEAEVATSRHLGAGAATTKSEGLLACDPAVRSDFDRLKRLRDEAWELDRRFLRRAKHGPYQVLLDVLRRAAKASERHHVKNADSYLEFMRSRYPWADTKTS